MAAILTTHKVATEVLRQKGYKTLRVIKYPHGWVVFDDSIQCRQVWPHGVQRTALACVGLVKQGKLPIQAPLPGQGR